MSASGDRDRPKGMKEIQLFSFTMVFIDQLNSCPINSDLLVCEVMNFSLTPSSCRSNLLPLNKTVKLK